MLVALLCDARPDDLPALVDSRGGAVLPAERSEIGDHPTCGGGLASPGAATRSRTNHGHTEQQRDPSGDQPRIDAHLLILLELACICPVAPRPGPNACSLCAGEGCPYSVVFRAWPIQRRREELALHTTGRSSPSPSRSGTRTPR